MSCGGKVQMSNKSTIDFVKHWILPEGFQEVLIDLFYSRRSQIIKEYSSLLKENKKIKNIYKGKRCFIIGNGPSLANHNLNKLTEEYTFTVSHFFMTEWFDIINPFGYVVADPVLFEDSDFAIKWLMKLDRQCKNQNLFFPIYAVKTVQKYNLFQNRNVYYLDMSGQFHEDISKFDIDLIKKIPGAQTVIIMAIIIAAYMGFNKIYLIGCDSDWAKYPSARGYLPHFYSENNKITKPETCSRQDWMYEDVLNAALIIFKSYRILYSKLNKKGINVFNATNDGFLDVFKRVDYAALFKDYP